MIQLISIVLLPILIWTITLIYVVFSQVLCVYKICKLNLRYKIMVLCYKLWKCWISLLQKFNLLIWKITVWSAVSRSRIKTCIIGTVVPISRMKLVKSPAMYWWWWRCWCLFTFVRYLARSFTLILPYFPTGTMERVDTEGQIATANVRTLTWPILLLLKNPV